MVRISLFLLSLAVANVSGAEMIEKDTAADAAETVWQFHAELQGISRDAGEAEFGERFDALAPVIDETHDLPYIGRLAVGRAWRDLSPEEQDAFQEKFRRLSIASYAGRFGGKSIVFRRGEAENATSGRIVVHTLLEAPDRREIGFDFHLHRANDQRWQIVNIMVDGVSDLALKRAEYSRIIREDGFDALLEALDRQFEDLAGTG